MNRKEWADLATKEFRGKKVKCIGWLSAEEVEKMDWCMSAPVIVFEDDSWIFAMQDDEGNDAGALATSSEKVPILPVIGV